jgi:ATP-dependent protease HslVU (ClpYQ) peptidase subunit
MSIVVAVSKGEGMVLAADTQSTFGGERVPAGNQASIKIRRVGEALLGRSGWGIYDNVLDDMIDRERPPDLGDRSAVFRFFLDMWKRLHERYPFVNDQSKSKDSPFGDLGGSFLVAAAGGIFYVAPNLGVTEFQRYYAIGSGADYSLGALHHLYDTELDPVTIARKAAETAVAFDVHCGGEIQILVRGHR